MGMKVNDLRKTLVQLVNLLEASDAKKGTISDLNSFVATIEAFGDSTLAQFVQYAEAGRNPSAGSGSRGTGRVAGGQKGTSTSDSTALINEVVNLYEIISQPQVTEEHVIQVCEKLKGIGRKPPLQEIGRKIQMEFSSSDTTAKMVDKISKRLLNVKHAAIKSTIFNRPAVPSTAIPEDQPIAAG